MCFQEILRRLQKHMEFEQRRLEDFREELQASGAPIIGALLCGAHFLEHSLGEPTGPLLLLEGRKLVIETYPRLTE